jgi:hypothetical protein
MEDFATFIRTVPRKIAPPVKIAVIDYGFNVVPSEFNGHDERVPFQRLRQALDSDGGCHLPYMSTVSSVRCFARVFRSRWKRQTAGYRRVRSGGKSSFGQALHEYILTLDRQSNGQLAAA